MERFLYTILLMLFTIVLLAAYFPFMLWYLAKEFVKPRG